MNPRQEYALHNPINSPEATLNPALQTTRRHGTGLILLTTLAVDR